MNQDKKRIVVISPFFFPELISTGKFNTDVVLALVKKGHLVTVLCSHPLYPKWIPEKTDKTLPGVKIKRGGSFIRYSNNTLIRRAVLEIWFSVYIVINIFKYRKNTDIIIPVFPPSLAFYVILPFIKKGTQRIGMVHDLQEVYSSGKKGFLNKIISFFINRIEGSTFRQCDKLIFLSEEMKSTAQKLYNLNENKLFVQYPFATINMDRVTTDLEEILPTSKKHVIYSGALGEKQNPQSVYDFFDYASTYLKDTEFHFFSQGNFFNSLKNNNKNSLIRFHDLVPRENLEELYYRSSVQVIPQLPETSKGSLPSKLPNLLASGCKILFITDPESEIELLFKKHKLERVVASWNKEILLRNLRELLDNNRDCDNQKRVAKELFSIDSMIKKIV